MANDVLHFEVDVLPAQGAAQPQAIYFLKVGSNKYRQYKADINGNIKEAEGFGVEYEDLNGDHEVSANDHQKLYKCKNANPLIVTLPDLVFNEDVIMIFNREGLGTVTFVCANANVQLNYIAGDSLAMADRPSSAYLKSLGGKSWQLTGQLE